jgi:prepilin-type N-terminal cleavage/methylation domain-containing protein
VILKRREAFTLIELMVSLVVAGVLMATLVGISGTVQRSFGRSKDIIELQANLRIAMHGLVEDLSRAAYMYSPNPAQGVDRRTLGIPPPQAQQAVDYDVNTDILTLRGNYVSSRDYLWNLDDKDIRCRNEMKFDGRCCDAFGTGPDCFDFPFADGPGFKDVFCTGEVVRLDVGNGSFSYHTINTATEAGTTITLNPVPVRADQVQGTNRWISPMTTVQYQMTNDPAYVSPYTGGVLEAQRWSLVRTSDDCRGTTAAEVADFLLPPTSAAPGFIIEPYNITTVGGVVPEVCMSEFGFTVDPDPTPIAAGTPIDPVALRAAAVILRGRVETEDPALTVAHPDHSVDLDGNPANGMAHVRVERTMIQLRNTGLTYCVP